MPHCLPALLPQTPPPSATTTAPPPSPSAPVPESSLAVPFPLCLQPANQCPTFRRRCPTPASRCSPRCRWPRSVRRVPSRPAAPGLAPEVAAAASARPSALSAGTRNRSRALPAPRSQRSSSSPGTAASGRPTAGSRWGCPSRRRFSVWYVDLAPPVTEHVVL